MKKSISLLFIISILAVLPFLNSCKKGAEDPFLTLKSRDGRITRTWVLSNITESETIVTDITQNNDINDDVYTSNNKEVTETTYDGTSLTEDNEVTFESESQSTQIGWSWGPSGAVYTFTQNTYDYKEVTTVNKVYDYSVTVQIDDDNTYTATYTKTLKSMSQTYSETENSVTTTYESDTTYAKDDTQTWVEEGDWFWIDSNDDKVIIYAGPMQGKLLKLSSKEVLIDDVTSESDDDTDYTATPIYTYDDSTDGYKTEEGYELETTNTTTERTYKATWTAQE
ncbi:MAG TPA: hypothetical protein DDX39_02015 [Bacteroidales bacterium]|nr:MAG: hypothetical protein A2W98_08635 [Bacteroidetes bacterium GWF2_33_38]OFY92227.1 MAG: hypothetical protein A2236_04900 [Bacteroidetes bacterium RIFOXYA2_FULL_33_7]HBF87389.1 hypothetical protein [Bacteroidales bacterium]